MEIEIVKRMLDYVEHQKGSVLLLAPSTIPLIADRTLTIDTSNFDEVTKRIFSSDEGGFYHDPNRLLTVAAIGKMIVV